MDDDTSHSQVAALQEIAQYAHANRIDWIKNRALQALEGAAFDAAASTLRAALAEPTNEGEVVNIEHEGELITEPQVWMLFRCSDCDYRDGIVIMRVNESAGYHAGCPIDVCPGCGSSHSLLGGQTVEVTATRYGLEVDDHLRLVPDDDEDEET